MESSTNPIDRLGQSFEAPFFGRGKMTIPALSMNHFWRFMETSVGPVQKLIEGLASDPKKLVAIRAEFEAITQPYYRDNEIHQDYLLTRAKAL